MGLSGPDLFVVVGGLGRGTWTPPTTTVILPGCTVLSGSDDPLPRPVREGPAHPVWVSRFPVIVDRFLGFRG